MDLVRQLQGLAKQLDSEGRIDPTTGKKFSGLRPNDGQVLRSAAGVICKQAAEIASLKASLEAHNKKEG